MTMTALYQRWEAVANPSALRAVLASYALLDSAATMVLQYIYPYGVYYRFRGRRYDDEKPLVVTIVGHMEKEVSTCRGG
jgi:hypothetical protein